MENLSNIEAELSRLEDVLSSLSLSFALIQSRGLDNDQARELIIQTRLKWKEPIFALEKEESIKSKEAAIEHKRLSDIIINTSNAFCDVQSKSLVSKAEDILMIPLKKLKESLLNHKSSLMNYEQLEKEKIDISDEKVKTDFAKLEHHLEDINRRIDGCNLQLQADSLKRGRKLVALRKEFLSLESNIGGPDAVPAFDGKFGVGFMDMLHDHYYPIVSEGVIVTGSDRSNVNVDVSLLCYSCKMQYSSILKMYQCAACNRNFCHFCSSYAICTSSETTGYRACFECFQVSEKQFRLE